MNIASKLILKMNILYKQYKLVVREEKIQRHKETNFVLSRKTQRCGFFLLSSSTLPEDTEILVCLTVEEEEYENLAILW